MIEVTRLNGEKFWLNPNLIETMEATPDTVIKLTNDKKLIVSESPSDIISKIIEYNRKIFLEKTRTS
ncbi:MAG: flagellar protein FlbD [Candidatus Hydrogenedentota bacterium]|nr:MAG: flagellar protein FlbD [Candidatus Hydrogenedentota bacterium]